MIYQVADGVGNYWPAAPAAAGTENEKWAQNVARPCSFAIRMQEKHAGLVLTPQGTLPHVLASTLFTPADGADQVDIQPQMDFNFFLATISIQADDYVEASQPAEPQTTGVLRKLVIDVGHRARLDYVCPSTVVAYKDGGLIYSNGGFVRDDRPILQNLAQAAWAWYGTPRQSFELTYHQLMNVRLGALVTSTGAGATEQTINSVITHVQMDLRKGTTTIKTNFAELDAGSL
jgi:hypothetical protein